MTSRKRTAKPKVVVKELAPGEAQVGLPDWRLLVGHDDVLERWRELIVRGGLPQVVLLEGRDGIGKRGLLAAMVALHACDTNSACGECQGCLWVLSGRHPDVFWWEAEDGKLLIEDAERFQEHLDLSPESGKRFAVIVDADQMSVQAANRLLKTLEEPADAALIILSTSRLGAMLKTILSRCVVWRIKPPPVEASLELLRERLEAAQRGDVSDEAIRVALKRCGRSPGKALGHLLQQGAGDVGAPVQDLLSAVRIDAALGLADELAKQSGLSLAELLHEWEIELNRIYRRVAASPEARPDPRSVAERRRILREAKALALKGKVPLNAQMTAESLALVRHQ